MSDTPLMSVPAPGEDGRLHPLDSWITALADVYVIAHMAIAHVDRERWRLTVGGLVDHVLTLDYDQLTSLPSREVTAVIECFGNPLKPDVPTRRVGNVIWRGVAHARQAPQYWLQDVT